MMNRCAHKGSRLVSAPVRQHRQVLPLPLPRLDLQDRRLAAGDPAEERLRGHALQRMRGGQGPDEREERAQLPRLHLRQASTTPGPDFEEYFGDSLSSIDNMADRSPGGRARDRRRLPALHAPVQLEDVRREPQRHHAPDGGARVVGRHRQDDVGRQAGRRAQADGDRAVRALHVRLQVLRGHGRAGVRQRPQLLGRATSASTASTRRSRSTTRR